MPDPTNGGSQRSSVSLQRQLVLLDQLHDRGDGEGLGYRCDVKAGVGRHRCAGGQVAHSEAARVDGHAASTMPIARPGTRACLRTCSSMPSSSWLCCSESAGGSARSGGASARPVTSIRRADPNLQVAILVETFQLCHQARPEYCAIGGVTGMHSNNLRRTALAAICLIMAAAQVGAQTADGWISHAEFRSRTPVVLHFRRELELQRVPASLPVQVTADNRFILYVNGARVASGPSTGSIAELALFDRGYRAESAPRPQCHRGRGLEFRRGRAHGADERGHGIPSHRRGHLDARPGLAREAGSRPRGRFGARATVVAVLRGQRAGNHRCERADWDWAGDKEVGEGWQDAEPAPEAAARTLVADKLPPQTYSARTTGHGGTQQPAGGERFPAQGRGGAGEYHGQTTHPARCHDLRLSRS